MRRRRLSRKERFKRAVPWVNVPPLEYPADSSGWVPEEKYDKSPAWRRRFADWVRAHNKHERNRILYNRYVKRRSAVGVNIYRPEPPAWNAPDDEIEEWYGRYKRGERFSRGPE
jgi:hypothetical protein